MLMIGLYGDQWKDEKENP